MTCQEASRVLTAGLGSPAVALTIAPAAGAAVSSVWYVTLNRPPGRAVLKVAASAEPLARECQNLAYLRQHTRFPVPDTYFLLPSGGNGLPDRHVLGLEWVRGVSLGSLRLPAGERDRLDEQIADAVSELHTHTRSLYGTVDGSELFGHWVDRFRPRFDDMVTECDGRTDPQTIAVSRWVSERLEAILAERGRPATLVHGDLWAGNILVDPDAPGGVALRAFIDPGTEYQDVECELAYLEVFNTVGPRFWEVYLRQRALDPGYPLRRLVYHLHTMLVHIWYFGDPEYHHRAAALARQLAQALDSPAGRSL
ncbi:MAG: aminoglycoside phosphotransferase family protein [Armatimonadetes bacterium]|nr:aminoglycoside phosphotransferase family protein [Armatimonadota bacterium]